LSVVVPTHDTRELTLCCLASLAAARLDATEAGTEVIVVDDGSHDGTADAIRRAHPAARVLSRERAGGFTIAANLGLAAAAGEIILLLNSDTEVDPAALPRLLDAFAARTRLGVAGAALSFPDGRRQWSGGREPDPLWLFLLASGLPGLLERVPGYRRVRPVSGAGRVAVDWVTGAAMAMRREVWERHGPLDERFDFYGQDVDFCMRVRDAGWDVAILSDVGVRHHASATISRRPGAGRGGVNPGLLWTDLLRVVEKRRGQAAARRAARALLQGARLRLLGRTALHAWLARPGSPGRAARLPAAWHHETGAFVTGVRAVRQWVASQRRADP
jgi:GT2 family glycosyltransferase